MATKKKAASKSTEITIKRPNYQVLEFSLSGKQYVSNAMSREVIDGIRDEQQMDSATKAAHKKASKTKPKDFNACYEGSMHVAETEGFPPKKCKKPWYGIPAMAFKSALVRACSVTDLQMTQAKMLLFVLDDGTTDDGRGLVRIHGKPRRFDSYVRTPPGPQGSTNIASRAMWDTWTAKLRVRYDADFFTKESVTNLVARAGVSVGVGAGRPFSSTSQGMGWGTFEISSKVKGS